VERWGSGNRGFPGEPSVTLSDQENARLQSDAKTEGYRKGLYGTEDSELAKVGIEGSNSFARFKYLIWRDRLAGRCIASIREFRLCVGLRLATARGSNYPCQPNPFRGPQHFMPKVSIGSLD
jgi:hypothetical protein